MVDQPDLRFRHTDAWESHQPITQFAAPEPPEQDYLPYVPNENQARRMFVMHPSGTWGMESFAGDGDPLYRRIGSSWVQVQAPEGGTVGMVSSFEMTLDSRGDWPDNDDWSIDGVPFPLSLMESSWEHLQPRFLCYSDGLGYSGAMRAQASESSSAFGSSIIDLEYLEAAAAARMGSCPYSIVNRQLTLHVGGAGVVTYAPGFSATTACLQDIFPTRTIAGAPALNYVRGNYPFGGSEPDAWARRRVVATDIVEAVTVGGDGLVPFTVDDDDIDIDVASQMGVPDGAPWGQPLVIGLTGLAATCSWTFTQTVIVGVTPG